MTSCRPGPLLAKGSAYQDAKLAMAMPAKSNHYKLAEIRVRHWKDLAATYGEEVWPRMVEMVQNVGAVLDAVEEQLPPNFPAQTKDKIFAGIRTHGEKFLREMAAMQGERRAKVARKGQHLYRQLALNAREC